MHIHIHNKLRIIYCMAFFSRIFAEGTLPHAHCQVHQAASVCAASACVSLCYGEGPLSAVCWREGRSSLWQCQHSTPPASCQRFCAILPGFRFPFPKRCPICCFAMEVLLSFIHSISIPHSQSLARGIFFAPFWFYGGMAVNADPILALPGL